MTPDQIRRAVAKLQTTSVVAEDEAWSILRPLGMEVIPYLLEAYPTFGKWQGRVSLVFHSVRYARVSEEAYDLGLLAIRDRATLVRYRACGLLAYSLRRDAIPHLESLLGHSDQRTSEDASAAIDAIRHQNHHFFRDREHTGQIHWVVNDADRAA